MKMTSIKKNLSFILCIVLIAAIALFAIGCNDKDTTSSTPSTSQSESIKLGEGKISFNFTVTDLEGKEKSYQISTDKTIVGDALVELELISGDQGPYGLYVKTVDGVTVDYNKDGKYWAFYENGAYASKGVDATEITEGATYSFKAE